MIANLIIRVDELMSKVGIINCEVALIIRYTVFMDAMRSGFREREHTADWELEVWAPDICTLLEQAARGMYALSGTQIVDGSRQERVFKIEHYDMESLLVRFLSELLYIGEEEGLAFDHFKFYLQQDCLKAVVSGAALVAQEKEIKAVTYHNLVIKKNDQGLRVCIVFDV
jgi:SHS2 domain-containing protein